MARFGSPESLQSCATLGTKQLVIWNGVWCHRGHLLPDERMAANRQLTECQSGLHLMSAKEQNSTITTIETRPGDIKIWHCHWNTTLDFPKFNKTRLRKRLFYSISAWVCALARRSCNLRVRCATCYRFEKECEASVRTMYKYVLHNAAIFTSARNCLMLFWFKWFTTLQIFEHMKHVYSKYYINK